MDKLEIVAASALEAKSMSQICRGSFGRYYPGFEDWYRSKVLPGIGSSRWLLKAVSNGRLAGICIVKDDGDEKKICSLRVDVHHRGQGVGSALVEASIKLLEERRPVMTVPQEVVQYMRPLLDKFDFEEMGKCSDFYRKGSSEFFFNGTPDFRKCAAGLCAEDRGLIAVAAE